MAGAGPESNRVLWGGAFNNNERNVRCAYRNRNNPDNRNRNSGFRVVVAPNFASGPFDSAQGRL
jgi:formylglycine-generating enzyme required for sulfatase activity